MEMVKAHDRKPWILDSLGNRILVEVTGESNLTEISALTKEHAKQL